eukprot:SAG22_NODE_5088_length_1089_cov_0.817172_2_plen_22_part_01
MLDDHLREAAWRWLGLRAATAI